MATVVIGDNITALKWASVDAVTPKNKHIRTIYHWLREHIRDGSIDLRDCPTQDNLADCLTKPIVGPPAQRISDAISERQQLVDDWRLAGSAMRKRMNERTRARASLTIKKVY
eukprot:SAG31_NODE_4470_length_3205_cov_70.394915_4_plen_113_part_00